MFLPNEEINYYEVLSSSYEEEVDMFFIDDFLKDKQLGVELHLCGIAAVLLIVLVCNEDVTRSANSSPVLFSSKNSKRLGADDQPSSFRWKM
jgi:hypothetical protein